MPKFEFDRNFAFSVIKARKLADLKDSDDIYDVIVNMREAGPVPSTFVREDAIKGANGNVVYLQAAFAWGETPQGQGYWQDLPTRKRALTRKDKAILFYWAALDAAVKNEEVDCDEPNS